MNLKLTFVPFMDTWLITWGDPTYPNFKAVKNSHKHLIPSVIADILGIKEAK